MLALRWDGYAVRAAAVAMVIVVALLAWGCDGPPEETAREETSSEALVDRDTETEALPTPAGDAAGQGGSVGGIPTLLDLGADKCVPCKMMAPILDELRETYSGRLDVVFIDVWKDRDAAREYGVSVIPTQVFLDADGKELFRHQGFMSREDILAKWAELGYEFDT